MDSVGLICTGISIRRILVVEMLVIKFPSAVNTTSRIAIGYVYIRARWRCSNSLCPFDRFRISIR